MISATNLEPVRSEHADDEDFAELLVMFADEIPDRRERLEAAFAARNIEEVKTLAHQLKGAGGGYGFPDLTIVAARLENACKLQDEAEMQSGFDSLQAYLARITC